MPMYPQDRERFPENFPQSLVDSGRLLPEFKLIEAAWKYEGIKKVINFLVDAGYVIRGGDVYLEERGQWYQMADNWYVDYPDPTPMRERTEAEKQRLLEVSRQQSLAYVENYWKRNGDHYYYTVVFPPAYAHLGRW